MKKKRANRLKIAIAAITLVTVTFVGLTIFLFLRNDQATASLLFQDNSCSVGCWHNFRPGITTQQDVINFIEDKNLESNLMTRYNGLNTTYKDLPVRFFFFENLLEVIKVAAPQGGLDLTISRVIDELGEPDAQVIETDDWNVVGPSLRGTLYFFEEGYSFTFLTLGDRGSQTVCFTEDLQVKLFHVFAPDDHITMLRHASGYGDGFGEFPDPQETEMKLEPWKGSSCYPIAS